MKNILFRKVKGALKKRSTLLEEVPFLVNAQRRIVL